MFDVGFWEILLILVLALVVIGPERLPGAARKAGYFVGKARRYIEGVRSEVESELDIGEFKRILHNQEVQINELQQQLKSGANEIESDLKSDINADIPDDVSVADLLEDTPTHSFHDESAVAAKPVNTSSDVKSETRSEEVMSEKARDTQSSADVSAENHVAMPAQSTVDKKPK